MLGTRKPNGQSDQSKSKSNWKKEKKMIVCYLFMKLYLIYCLNDILPDEVKGERNRYYSSLYA